MTNGSDWILKEIQEIKVNIAKYEPIEGSSYIQSAFRFRGKKGVINVQNDDQKCFF